MTEQRSAASDALKGNADVSTGGNCLRICLIRWGGGRGDDAGAKVKVQKGKVCPRTGHEGPEWGVGLSFCSFFNHGVRCE